MYKVAKIWTRTHRYNFNRNTVTTCRNLSTKLYMAGQGWTGALGSGQSTMIDADTSSVSSSERDNHFTFVDSLVNGDIKDIAAGWGHTALVQNDKLYVAGRPYDFQNVLRLKRMPPFIRRLVVQQSLNMDDTTKEKTAMSEILGKAVNFVFQRDEDETYYQSVFPNFVEMSLPNDDTPASNENVNIGIHKKLAASAGITAVIGAKEGNVYTFGLNNRGQCGIGQKKMPHVWKPTPVSFKTEKATDTPDLDVSDDSHLVTNIKSVDLGLQHGLILDVYGNLYGFGKGARGQLGKAEYLTASNEDEANMEDDSKESSIDMEYSAISINEFEVQTSEYKSYLTENDAKVITMSTGWNHSAAITQSNHVFVWGKNATAEWNDKDSNFKAKDSPSPMSIQGLPSNLQIQHVACGSHHTAILMEDGSVYAIGISTDTVNPIGKEAVRIVPPGLIDLPVQQFTSHFDRTTIVAGEKGQQVLEVQLWSTEELRDTAVFEPEWLDTLLQDKNGIRRVERGWLHTAVITA